MGMRKRGMTHGTVSGYSNHNCRCDECRQAYRVYWRATRERRRMELLGKGQNRRGWAPGAAQPTETPVAVVTTREPAPTPYNAAVEEIRERANELRRERGW